MTDLWIDVGPSYRVSFGRVGDRFVVLPYDEDKRRQHADIERAKRHWADCCQKSGTQ